MMMIIIVSPIVVMDPQRRLTTAIPSSMFWIIVSIAVLVRWRGRPMGIIVVGIYPSAIFAPFGTEIPMPPIEVSGLHKVCWFLKIQSGLLLGLCWDLSSLECCRSLLISSWHLVVLLRLLWKIGRAFGTCSVCLHHCLHSPNRWVDGFYSLARVFKDLKLFVS